MKKIIALLFITACASVPKSRDKISNWTKKPMSEQIKPFVSDGCSMWPEGTRKKRNVWLKCCFKHDLAYWMGGTSQQRKIADQKLRSCVKDEFKEWMGILMYMGVRVGGGAQYRTSYRWGYGWNYDRGYLPISSEEMTYIQTLIPTEKDDPWKFIKPGKVKRDNSSKKLEIN